MEAEAGKKAGEQSARGSPDVVDISLSDDDDNEKVKDVGRESADNFGVTGSDAGATVADEDALATAARSASS